MLRTLTLVGALVAFAGAAAAQQPNTEPPAAGGPPTSVNTEQNPAPIVATPKPGANSFTQTQAQERLQANGFTGVNQLMQDKDGIWRGTAMHGGKSVPVAVDYQGNIVAN